MTPRLVIQCGKCGADVPLLNDMAASSARRHGITCESCRRGDKWTTESYAAYLQTEHWKAKRGEALRVAGDKCQVCASVEQLEVHHNDYSRLGGELRTDLVVLCRDCHELFHGKV